MQLPVTLFSAEPFGSHLGISFVRSLRRASFIYYTLRDSDRIVLLKLVASALFNHKVSSASEKCLTQQ